MQITNRWLFATIIVTTMGISCQHAAASFDGDANGDILTAHKGGSLGWVEVNGGSIGGIHTWANNQGADTVREIAVDDIDGDGNGDILTARKNGPSTGEVTWTERDNNNLAGQPVWFNVSPANSIASGDLDGDADGDLILGRDDGYITWVERNGGNLSGVANYNMGSVVNVAIGDMDGDADGDIIVGKATAIQWVERNGNGIAGVSSAFNLGTATTALEVGNLDNNGDGDIVAGRADGRVTLIQRSGNNITGHPSNNNFNVGSIADLALADVNGDGDDEIILAQGGTGGSVMVLDDPGTGFTRISQNWYQAVGNDHSITALDVGDLDGDEFLDVVVGRSDGWIHWMEITNGGATIGGVQNYNMGDAITDLRIASPTPIPEPASIALLMASGLVGLLGTRRRS